MPEDKQAPTTSQRLVAHPVTVGAKAATPEQIRAELESLKLKEQKGSADPQ
jgi:hypothetical protein